MPSELETLRQQVEAEKQMQELVRLRAEVADEKRRQQEGGELAELKAALAKERARSAPPAAANPPKKKKQEENSEVAALKAALAKERARASPAAAKEPPKKKKEDSEVAELKAALAKERARRAPPVAAEELPKKKKARRGARKSSSSNKEAAPATTASVISSLPVAPPSTNGSIVGALPVSPVAPRASAPAAAPAAAPPHHNFGAAPHLKAWSALAKQTAASERFRAAAARLDALAAKAPAAWIKSRPYGAWCEHLPQALAIDCEMCVTEDPASGALDGKALVRISIVDASRLDACTAAAVAGGHDDVVLDSLVKPSLPIKDAVDRVHGIKASDLDSVLFTLEHAQAALAKLCSDRTVLIGHAVTNDLEALRFRHGCIVDTSVCYGVAGAPAGVAPSLRDVAAAVLPNDQGGIELGRATHDSRVDARTAALCAYHLIGGAEPLPKAVERRKHAREERSLFAHRIPAGVADATLRAAVERTTGVALAADAAVTRGGAYGKCTLILKSPLHAQLAFDTLAGPAEVDTSGRPQKKIYLDDGEGSGGKRPYCKVRPF